MSGMVSKLPMSFKYVTANCIFEIHCLALDGFNLKTVHKLSSKEKKILAQPRFVPGAAGWEAKMLLLCYAAPTTTKSCTCLHLA